MHYPADHSRQFSLIQNTVPFCVIIAIPGDHVTNLVTSTMTFKYGNTVSNGVIDNVIK